MFTKKIVPTILLILLLVSSCKVTQNSAQSSSDPEEFLKQGERIPKLINGGNWEKDSTEFLDTKNLVVVDFDEADWIKNWILEGPGHVKTGAGGLAMNSVLAPSFIKSYEAGEFTWDDNAMKPYFDVLEDIAKKTIPGGYKKLYDSQGQFRGGHIVLWNKQKSAEHYVIEFDLKHDSPMGLFILFFSANGLNGKDLFSNDLTPRNGIFSQYVRGDNQSYHISTYTPHRGSANLRRNPGAHLLKTENDIAFLTPTKKSKYRLIKWGNRFQYYLDDQLQMDFTDHASLGSPLRGGYVGLRLMAGDRITVNKFRIHSLLSNPFKK